MITPSIISRSIVKLIIWLAECLIFNGLLTY